MKFTQYCNSSDFKNLSNSCNNYDAYFDEDDTSYITYVAAYANNLLIGFISCITPNLSVIDKNQICYIEITAMVHPNYRHQNVFSNLLLKLYMIINNKTEQFNKKNRTSISIQFICVVDDDNAKKYHLILHSCEYLMLLNDTTILDRKNLKPISKDIKLSTKIKNKNDTKNNFQCYFNDDKSCYMLFIDNDFSMPIAVCELEYFQSHTCISSVYVDNDKRGKKIGTCLIKNLIQDYLTSEHKNIPLILHVSSANPAAFKLYKNCGFSVYEQVSYYYINVLNT